MNAKTANKVADNAGTDTAIIKTPAAKGGNAMPWFMELDAAAMAAKARDELAKADKAQRRGIAYWFRAVALQTYQDAANLFRHDGSNTLGVLNIASIDLGTVKPGRKSGTPNPFSLWMERLCDVLIAYPMNGKDRLPDIDYNDEQKKAVAAQRVNIYNAARMFIDLENAVSKPGTEATLRAWDDKLGLLVLPHALYAPYGYHVTKDAHGDNIPMDGRTVYLTRSLVGDERNNDSTRALNCMVPAQASWVRQASMSRSKKRIWVPNNPKLVGDGILQPTMDADIKAINNATAAHDKANSTIVEPTATANGATPAPATSTTVTVTSATTPSVSATPSADTPTVRAPHSDSDTVQSIGFDKLVLELSAILDRRLTEAGSEPVLPEHFSPKVWAALQSIASEVQAIENNALNTVSKEARDRKPGRDKAA